MKVKELRIISLELLDEKIIPNIINIQYLEEDKIYIVFYNEYDYKLSKYNDIARANARMKLGKLEDLEEQIGCPLEVRCKVSYHTPVYDKCGKKFYADIILDNCFSSHNCELEDKHCRFLWKDYKVTWWLKENKSE